MELDRTPGKTSALSRRRVLIWGGVAAVGGAVLAACGQAPSPTAAPAKPTEAPKPAATTAPAKPAEPTKPAAAAPTTAPGAAATKPAEPTKPAAAAGTPTGPTPTAAPVVAPGTIPMAKSSAKVTNKFQFIQFQDFHPDHNNFIRQQLEEWGKFNGWTMDITYAAGFQGGSDLNQKLVASVQSGTQPDILFHDVGVRQMVFLDILEDVTKLADEIQQKQGATHNGFKRASNFDNKWWGVPFYTRAGGFYFRNDVFKEASVNPSSVIANYSALRDAALKVSDPDKKRWGWGLTANRSGDGESLVQNLIHAHGGRLQDEAGQIVKLNSPETAAGLEWLKETYTDPKWAKMLPPGVNAWNDISNNEAFLAGTIMITQNAGTMLAKAYFDKVPFAKDILASQNPKSNDGTLAQSAGGAKFHIIKGTKNREAAEDTIRFMLGKEFQQVLWKTSTAYALPAFASGWDDPLIKEVPNSMAFKPVVDNDKWWGLATPGPITEAVDATAISNVYTDMMGEILKGKSVKDALTEGTARVVKIYKDFGYKGA
jgi:multiple sugar transport system substrate-binding protein